MFTRGTTQTFSQTDVRFIKVAFNDDGTCNWNTFAITLYHFTRKEDSQS